MISVKYSSKYFEWLLWFLTEYACANFAQTKLLFQISKRHFFAARLTEQIELPVSTP